MPHVTGIGWISAQGSGRGRKDAHFEMVPGDLPPISRKAFFKTPYPRFNRMDEFSKLGVSAVALALRDAGLDKWTTKREVGIVITTLYGCLHTDLDYFETVLPEKGAFASPALFSYTLPNCFLGEAASRFGLTGPGYVVSRQEDTGLSCVKAVLEDMDITGIKSALAGICDLGNPANFPLDLNITPGAAFMVIESKPRADFESYGTIHLNRAEEIFFDGRKMSDFGALIKACVRRIWKS